MLKGAPGEAPTLAKFSAYGPRVALATPVPADLVRLAAGASLPAAAGVHSAHGVNTNSRVLFMGSEVKVARRDWDSNPGRHKDATP